MPEDGGLINQALIGLKPVNACVHTYTKPQTSSTRSRGLGWRIHESVEDTKLSTNKQHSLSLRSFSADSAYYLFRIRIHTHSDTGTQTQWSAPNTILRPEVPTVPRTTLGQRSSLVPLMTSHVTTGTSTHLRAPLSFPVGQLHATPADGTSPRNHATGTRRPTP